ncbi:DMSO/TMAO reductase YedYZ molybdopterin-dependent catalytic subunit [Thermocatellispora tengchongensis]|uniref:DMSO/TMAO reductase YedYZ molybdopterin-dependent catalytic subunit n=1 Tax=Thermocatellispora tengchongensis TaxID=1073253 RepID=A0A840PMA8_9ACTN|nr:molybdopterin-dependent oxidoreductase [Thermocatellispora tengchongensis]MBB5138177.1 DMSO/TMAO reductase YedYZ molybdopterin-dependent catalytic subunit [Thermocatellispora tengchongensis]
MGSNDVRTREPVAVRSDEPSDPVPGWASALAGVAAGAVGLGIAQLAAGLIDGGAFPVVAVGESLIDLSPAPLKEWAIRTFGEDDKTVLVGGVFVVLALVSAGLGVLARHRFAHGAAGFGLFAIAGLLAVLTRPDAAAVDALPTVIGVAASLWALALLLRRMTRSYVPEPYEEPWDADGTADGTAGGTADDTAEGAAADGAERPVVMRAGADLRAFDRRALLTGVAGGAVVAGIGGFVGTALAGRKEVAAARADLTLPAPAVPAKPLPPGADLKIKGLAPFVTPNADFYRVDTAVLPPQVDPATWTLKIHGMVDRPIEITFAELIRRPLIEADVTLTCVSNEVGGPYVGNARWLGARMADILRSAGIRSGADMLLSTSADGWTCGTPVDVVMDGRDALFAIAMNGEALSVDHGFPVRQVVPGLYGYVSATKWVTEIKVTRFDQDTAYWTPRGWSEKGPIKTQSRIDVPQSGASVPAGRTTIAGVAWAQHRGMDAVEVQVDDGDWRLARLAETPGPDTWRQWSIEADLTKGKHTIAVRATDATGATQTASLAPPAPDGATGYHTINVQAV